LKASGRYLPYHPDWFFLIQVRAESLPVFVLQAEEASLHPKTTDEDTTCDRNFRLLLHWASRQIFLNYAAGSGSIPSDERRIEPQLFELPDFLQPRRTVSSIVDALGGFVGIGSENVTYRDLTANGIARCPLLLSFPSSGTLSSSLEL